MIDHLIIFTPNLELGCEYVEHHLGVRPVMGGRHPDLGTHNALLGLGPECYLEVMAPDPHALNPMNPAETALGRLTEPRLGTWVLRAENIEALHARAVGIGLGEVREGHRDNPDGTRITWRITDPFVFPYDGVVPFLIAWGDTPHPGTRLPKVGELTGLAVEHPDAEDVEAAFKLLDVSVPVSKGARPRLHATIDTPQGLVSF